MTKSVVICRSNDVNPDPRVEKIAASLVKNGCKVQIVGWNRNRQTTIPDAVPGAIVNYITIPADFGTGINNLFKLAKWQLRLFAYLVERRTSYQIIHACDFDTVIPAFLCKIFLRKKLVYDIFDFYADHIQINSSVLLKAIRIIDKFIINRTDTTIIVDESRINQIKGTNPKVLKVIYNTPYDVFDNNAKTCPTKDQNNKLRLVFVGVIHSDRGILELLSLLKTHPDWHLDLAGFGSYLETILPLTGQLENVTWHGKVDYVKALELNASADVLIALYDPKIINNRYSSPNKLYEAMMLSKPIVVSRHTTMAQKVEKYAIGCCVNYGDIQELEQTLEKLKNENLREQLGTKARSVYEQHFSWINMEKRLVDIYSKL